MQSQPTRVGNSLSKAANLRIVISGSILGSRPETERSLTNASVRNRYLLMRSVNDNDSPRIDRIAATRLRAAFSNHPRTDRNETHTCRFVTAIASFQKCTVRWGRCQFNSSGGYSECPGSKYLSKLEIAVGRSNDLANFDVRAVASGGLCVSTTSGPPRKQPASYG